MQLQEITGISAKFGANSRFWNRDTGGEIGISPHNQPHTL